MAVDQIHMLEAVVVEAAVRLALLRDGLRFGGSRNHVDLADRCGVVPGLSQDARKEPRIVGRMAADHPTTQSGREASRQHRCAARGTGRLGHHALREQRGLGSQPVEIWRPAYRAAVAPQRVGAKLVGEYENGVGMVCHGRFTPNANNVEGHRLLLNDNVL